MKSLIHKISVSGSIPCEVSAVVKNIVFQIKHIFTFLRNKKRVRKSALFSVQNVEAVEVCYVQIDV